jgi:hypothetical protein
MEGMSLDKQAIVQEAISEMRKIIQNLNLDNVEQIEADLLPYFRFLKA